MTRTFYILICFSLLDIISFGQTKDDAVGIKVRGNPTYFVDGVKVVQSLDTAKLTVFYKNKSTLTQGQIKIADSILINAVSHYNSQVDKGQTQNKDSIVLSYGTADKIDIEKYCRQYTVGTFNDGSNIVEALCFCDDMVPNNLPDWKKTPVKIHEGGSCVFSIWLDLNKKTGRLMRVNGR